MVKRNGKWRETDWNEALEFASAGLKAIISKRGGGNKLGGLAAPNATLEELYLFQKLLRALGSHNIDHRLRQLDFSDQESAPLFPWLGQSIVGLLSPLFLIGLLINALFLWVIYSGATYAVAKYLLDGHGVYASYLRITGFAYPTLILIVFVSIVVSNGFLAFAISGIWFVIVVANGIMYLADLSREKAFAAAIGGYIVVVIVRTIFSNLFSF